MDRQGMDTEGMEGADGQRRQGTESYDIASRGFAGYGRQCGEGTIWKGGEGFGIAGMASTGMDWCGPHWNDAERHGAEGEDAQERRVEVGQARRGLVGCGMAR